MVVAAAQAATLDGQVRERGSGDPVDIAWVRVADVEVRTDRDGRFSLEVPEGTHRVVVASEVHAPQELEITVPGLPVTVWLVPDAAPLEIVVEARRASPHVSRQVLDRERVLETPGTHADPLRLIQALPGVTLTPEYSPASGDIALRGSAPAESRIYVDDVELPYLYHFQEYASVIHTRLLDEVAVYPSTFGAGYGDSTGGVVAVSTQRPDPAKLHGGANVNFIMGGGYATAPLGEGTAAAVSGRRSYLDLAEDSNDQYTLWPVFWDYLGQVDHEAGADQRYRLIALGAGDSYGRYAGDTELLDPLEQEDNPAFTYRRAFHALIGQAHNRTGEVDLRTSVGAVRDRGSGTLPASSELRDEDYLVLRHQLLAWSGDRDWLSAGLDARLSRLQRLADPTGAIPELTREAPMLARGLAVDERQVRLGLGPWVEPRIHLGRTRMHLGLRGLIDSAEGDWALDPRLGLQSEVAPDFHIRAAAGRYSQSPPTDLLGADGLADASLARSEQAAVGMDLAVAGRWELGLDLWGKRITNTWSRTSAGDPVRVDGDAVGLEIQSRYRLRDRFFSWASLSLGRARRDGHVFAYDQPVAVNLVGSWEPVDGWTLGVRYRWGSGLPYTPVVDGLYLGDEDRYEAVLGEDYSARLPAYQKLDLQIDRTWTFQRWRLGAYLALWWVPPSGNVLYPAFSFDYSEEAYVEGPPLLPLLGMHIDF